METIKKLNHAYSQAPWRIERQWISLSLLTVLGLGAIATLYLIVSSQAAIVGREIQNLRFATIETEHENSDLQTKLARLTSRNEIDKRAYALGFRPVEPEELEYLYVSGYVVSDAVTLAATPDLQPSPLITPPEYTQSLLDWFEERFHEASRGLR